MGFSNDIKIVRQTALLSQQAFAKELGVSFSTVNRWETGKTKPTYKAMQAINSFCQSHHIDYNISEILREEEI